LRLSLSGRCVVIVLALLIAGPATGFAQDPSVPGDGPGLEPPALDEQLARDPSEQSPRDLIGSRWPEKNDDAPAAFAVKKTDRLGEAMREAQAAQESAAKAAAQQAAADARAAERAEKRGRRFAGRHGSGKHFAGRARGRSRVASAQGASGRAVARASVRTKYAGKAASRRQVVKVRPSRRHRA
jgi:hypothetical protein